MNPLHPVNSPFSVMTQRIHRITPLIMKWRLEAVILQFENYTQCSTKVDE